MLHLNKVLGADTTVVDTLTRWEWTEVPAEGATMTISVAQYAQEEVRELSLVLGTSRFVHEQFGQGGAE